MKKLASLTLILLLVLVISCAKQPKTSINKESLSNPRHGQSPSYSIYKGRDFSFRYPSSWTISSRGWLYTRGQGIVSVNNFKRENFWPGMHSDVNGGGSWSTGIAQLQVPSDGAFFMIWVFEGPGNSENLPNKLNKAELKRTSKAKGPMEQYSMSFQSGGIEYQLNLFLNGKAIKTAKGKGLAIIKSLKLASVKPASKEPKDEALTLPLRIEANGMYETVTRNPVIFTDDATHYGEQPLADIDATDNQDKNFTWTILEINPEGTIGEKPQFVRFLVKISDFKRPGTLQFKVKPGKV